jgi:DNA invertase Pin-like site-specific DNA recombinase
MLADIKKEESASAIIVYSYDRFSRSGANGIYLLDNLRILGVRIISITQEVDSFTPTGNFQENLYMLLSKLDNDMRKDKWVTGTRSILRRGYWPYGTPTGYTNENKGTTADKHVYTINSDGLLLKLAFKWKASGKYTNQEIIDNLSAKGLKVTIRYMAWVFANPFYCGYISTSLLPGEMIEGKHPPLIDVDTFLQANNISRQNPRSGVSKISTGTASTEKFCKRCEVLKPFYRIPY